MIHYLGHSSWNQSDKMEDWDHFGFDDENEEILILFSGDINKREAVRFDFHRRYSPDCLVGLAKAMVDKLFKFSK